jgi:8-oxo-dGTP diphosphatase
MPEDDHREMVHYVADVVLLHTDEDGEVRVLLIRRGKEPYLGHWALPGGHVKCGETARQAAARELAEETGICVAEEQLVEVGAFDAPGRDPRGRYVSVAFAMILGRLAEPTAGDDAADVAWRSAAPGTNKMAFDHDAILAETASILDVGMDAVQAMGEPKTCTVEATGHPE